MISHILYRNRKFEESNSYLKQMEESMNEYNHTYFQQFFLKYTMLQAANFSYLNQNEKSIEILTNISEQTTKKLPNEDQLNIKINLAVYYFNQALYKKANLLLQTLNHSDNWLEKKMGREWVLKKNIIEILLQYELGNIDVTLNRIRSFERNYADLHNHSLYGRVFQYMDIIKEIIDAPQLLKNKSFLEEVQNTLVKTPSEQEDLQAIAFYSWLKSKMTGNEYYEVLLNIANRSNDK